MKHGKKFRSLSRTKSHRKALLGNLASELIKYKRIKTTLAKGKELRKYVEPILTRSKTDTTHNRRMAFHYLLNNEQAKALVTELFREIGPKIADRPGGYTRIIKLPPRQGDNAPMCYIELVDYNELLLANTTEAAKPKTRRSRRGGAKKVKDTTTEATATKATTEATSTEEVKTESKATKTEAKKADKSNDKADDLTKVEGIGPKISEVLTTAGIVTFADLAGSTPEAVKEILANAGGSLKSKDPTTWCDQAKMAAEGKWDELKKWQDEMDGGKPTE